MRRAYHRQAEHGRQVPGNAEQLEAGAADLLGRSDFCHRPDLCRALALAMDRQNPIGGVLGVVLVGGPAHCAHAWRGIARGVAAAGGG